MVLIRTNVTHHTQAALGPDQAPSGDGYGPSSLQSAYSLPSSTAGSRETVAVVDAYDDPDAASDLATYRADWGLPPCGSGCFEKVNEKGQASPLPAAAGSTGWDVEESLDIDMVSAICPLCHIILVEANSADATDLGAGVNAAVSLGADFVSDSYGGSESSSDTTYDSEYYNHPGVAVTASAGDSGYGVSYPAASRYVTSVGGTSLSTASNSRGWTETVWGSSSGGEGTGSGCSADDPKPSWQTDTGCSKRTDNDVAAVADPNTGLAVYDTYSQGGWLEVGGTSASSPIIASTFALAGTPAAGTYPSSYIYQHTSNLHNVTSGADGSCSPAYLCTAEVGYNGPTGWGTPDGVAAFSSGTTSSSSFVAAGPVRVLDTRNGTGGYSAPVGPGRTISLQVTGVDGVPSSGVTAVVLNVTATGPTASSFVTVYPDGHARPLASDLNFTRGETIPNLVVVPVGADGKADFYNSAGSVNLVADLAGYYTSGTGSSFVAAGPVRVLDTRNGTGGYSAPVGPGRTISLQVTGVDGVPSSGVTAVVLNVTATGPTASSFVTVYPDGHARPLASDLNFTRGETIPNLVVVPVGADGKADFYNSAGSVNLVADLAGYYTSGTGSSFVAAGPVRVLDTRNGTGGYSAPVGPGRTISLQVTGVDGVPSSGVTAVVLNVTATGPTASSFVTVYPDGHARPLASDLNFTRGETIPNLVVVPVGADGKADFYNSAGSVNLVADLAGYYVN